MKHANCDRLSDKRRCGRWVGVVMLTLLLSISGRGVVSGAAPGPVRRVAGFGLDMRFDTRWPDGPGYRPFRITVRPTVPVRADRTLTVEMVAQRYRVGHPSELRVVRDIEIPAGTPVGTRPILATISVPHLVGWNTYRYTVLEDGKELPGFSFTGSPVAGTDMSIEASYPRILFVSSRLPDTTEIAPLFPSAQNRQYAMAVEVAEGENESRELPTAMAIAATDLPERWIDYSNLDIICVSLDQLALLAEKHPGAFRAIVDWVSVGGNLWVYRVGLDWHGLPELEKLLGLPSGKPDEPGRPVKRGWIEPDKGLYGQPIRDLGRGRQAAWAEGYRTASPGVLVEETKLGVLVESVKPEEATIPSPPPPKPPERPHFVFREYDMGMVVALGPRYPFPGKKHDWAWVFKTTGPQRWLWYKRHGLSMVEQNRDFWNFLIPGVGLAPVTEFRVLITLFVLAIGPVNYYLLRRWGRLHLLVITIPLGAVAVTAALFGYALVADGLGTRVRVRSVTRLDQAAAHAACWARLSYYAGLAPSGGLSFPADVAVFPLEYLPGVAGENRRREQELMWEDDQRLVSGWLDPRTPTQYVTVRSRSSNHRVEIVPSGGQPGRLAVRNRLGARINQLYLRAGDGKHYKAAGLAANATGWLKLVEPTLVSSELRATWTDQQLEFPPGLEQRSYSSVFGLRRRYRRFTAWSNFDVAEVSLPNQRTGRLEQSLALFGPATGAVEELLEPKSYVAILAESPEVALGIPSAREEASFHVILGTW